MTLGIHRPEFDRLHQEMLEKPKVGLVNAPIGGRSDTNTFCTKSAKIPDLHADYHSNVVAATFLAVRLSRMKP